MSAFSVLGFDLYTRPSETLELQFQHVLLFTIVASVLQKVAGLEEQREMEMQTHANLALWWCAPQMHPGP